MQTVDIPEVRQRRYCATCHAPTGTKTYPARTVEIPNGDEANTPSEIALLHYSHCPDHMLWRVAVGEEKQ